MRAGMQKLHDDRSILSACQRYLDQREINKLLVWWLFLTDFIYYNETSFVLISTFGPETKVGYGIEKFNLRPTSDPGRWS